MEIHGLLSQILSQLFNSDETFSVVISINDCFVLVMGVRGSPYDPEVPSLR